MSKEPAERAQKESCLGRRRLCKLALANTLGATVLLSKPARSVESQARTPGEAGAGANIAQVKKALMHVGDQSFTSGSKEDLEFLKRHGVDHADGGQPRYIPGQGWDLDEILRKKEKYESFGVSLDMLHLPLDSSGIDSSQMPNILLGRSPQRDREIADVCMMIEKAAKAGIYGLNYNLTILPVLRTGRTQGRGGSSYSTWIYTDAPKGPLTRAGTVTLEVFRERIAYFLERVVPVAGEHKVRLACHVADPGTVPGYRGIDRALGTVDGLKHLIETSPSPYHGLNLCIGSSAEMLDDPAGEIYDVVRYFGERKKIFNVHLRNIRGRRDNFQEVYPDNGDVDMYRVVKVLRDVEYPYMVMPDHAPQHPDDPGGRQAFAFAFGYIKAMIQAGNSLTDSGRQ